METVVSGLAENNYVISIANLGGIIAFLVILYGFAKWARRFAITAYRQNIRAAIYRARRRNYLRARRSALDLHMFIGSLVIYGLSLLLAAMATVMGIVGWPTRYTLPRDEKLSATLGVSPVWDTVIGTVILFAPLALMILITFATARLSVNTRRIRTKLIVRKWRGALSDKP